MRPKLDFKSRKFKDKYPNLAKEIELAFMKVKINSIRHDREIGENIASNNVAGYNPDVIDFLRRCDTEEEAKEIIDYVEKKGEITPKYAKTLRRQLKTQGVRSFGMKKEKNYYTMKGKQ